MTHRVGPKGQVVIPKPIRDRLGLEPGDEVDFEFHGDGVTVRPSRPEENLMGSLHGHDLTGMLESDRRAERR